MKNSTRAVGQKIREVRLGRHMTQAALCGTEMTRNHLSLIERGKALPSLGTLCYLADRLDIPVGYFFSTDERDDAKFASVFAIDDIKRAYTGREYDLCCRLCETVPQKQRSDEISMLLALSHMEEAHRAASGFLISEAAAHYKSAADAARRTCYLGADFRGATEYYELLDASLFQREIPDALGNLHTASSFVSSELIIFMKTLHDGDGKTNALTLREHRIYVHVLNCIRLGDVEMAFDRLRSLPDTDELPYYMRYRVLDTLEFCAERTGRYKTAYAASKRKLELLELGSGGTRD